MPDLEISNLPALAEAGVAATDPLAIADISASETKKVTVKDLIEAGVALIDAASIPAAKIGTLGTDQVATGAIQDDAVTNAKLEHSTISLGGISIALGGTDATPAFNLVDATGYTTANLSGTITNAQLAGSIVNSKLSNSSVSFGGISLNLGQNDDTPAFDLTDATGYKTTNLVGTITNAQLAGSIDVSKLVGSNVGFGGVTVALGQSDATPAFNLTDATGYPTSSLVGTITNAQLAGSIVNSKLTNSSVSFGGITVALGASDPTPAFNLTDATNYPASSLTGTITNAQLAGSIDVSKLASSSASIGGVTITLGTTDATPAFNLTDATGYPTSSLVGTITNAQLAGSIDATKIVSNSITSTQLAANSVTDSELANNAVDTGAVQNGAITNDKVETSTSATTGLDGATKVRDGSITAAKLNTSNIDRSLNVASGNLGINNAVSGGASTRSGISYNAEGLITSTVALSASDLPLATSSAVGGVSVGAGLSVNGSGVLTVSNSVTAANGAVKVNYNAQGAITGSSSLSSGDLPTATTSAKGAVQITSAGGLTIDGSGNLTTSTSGVGAGVYQSVTVNTKGVVTAGTALTAALVPDLSATKITSGTIDAARIAADSIDSSKLSNSSTTIIQSIAQNGYPTAAFTGQLLFDPIAEDAYLWDGNAWNAITTLTKGALQRFGTYNASTSKVDYVTAAGAAAGLTIGQNLPVASESVDGGYVVISVQGTPSGIAGITGQLSPPDYLLGVTASASSSSWVEIDLSTTVASQQASAISYTPYGQLSATNVQAVINEIEDEKLAKSGGTVTGEVLIGVNGSLVFEGSGSDDAFETTLTVENPTTSDKTITLPNITGTVITDGDTNTVTSTMVDGSLLNANLAAGAAIAFTKLADLTSAQILVGNASNKVAAVAVTGDISINNAGLTSIASNVIVDADIKSDAEISGSKIVDATTSVIGVVQLEDSTTSTSTIKAATPNAVKSAYDLAALALPKAGGTLTGHALIDNDKEVRFYESDGNGSAYVGIKGATDKASSGSYTISLPAAAPTTGQVLKAGSTATTLEWAADSATDSTKMPLAGGTFTGDVQFNGDSSNGLWDKSASAFVANLTGNVTGNVSGTSGGFTAGSASNLDSGTVNVARLGSGSSVTTKFLRGDNTWQTISATPEGTAILSTGESGGTKFLREDGDGTCSWQTATTSAAGSNTQIQYNNSGAFAGISTFTTDGSDITFVGASSKNAVWDTSDGALEFAANALLVFGDVSGRALRLSQTGTYGDSYIDNVGAGNFLIRSVNGTKITFSTTQDCIDCTSTGTVNLKAGGSTKLATVSGGVTVTGTLVADGLTVDGDVTLTGASYNVVWDKSDNALEFVDDAKATFGADADLQIYHDPNHSFIDEVANGNLVLRTNPSGTWATIVLQAGQENSIICNKLGSTELWHITGAGSTSKKLETTTAGITVTGTVSDSKGELRTIPQLSKSSAHTIVATDAGKHSINSSGGWVINTSTGFTAGQAITLINNSSGDQTITSTGVTLYNSADGSTPTKIATRGMATVICTASNTYYISGAGLS